MAPGATKKGRSSIENLPFFPRSLAPYAAPLLKPESRSRRSG